MTGTIDDEAYTQTDQSALHASRPEQNFVNRSTRGNDVDSITVSSDLWSAAYREAFDSLGDDIDVAILKGDSVAQLFKLREDMCGLCPSHHVHFRGVPVPLRLSCRAMVQATEFLGPKGRRRPTLSQKLVLLYAMLPAILSAALAFVLPQMRGPTRLTELRMLWGNPPRRGFHALRDHECAR